LSYLALVNIMLYILEETIVCTRIISVSAIELVLAISGIKKAKQNKTKDSCLYKVFLWTYLLVKYFTGLKSILLN